MSDSILLGAVAYDPKVVTIWEGIRDYFRSAPVGMDYVLFSNYGSQVDALLDGKIDVAWNTNLAYVRTHLATGGGCRALAMRDSDVEFHTLLVGRAGDVTGTDGLRGRRLALGSADSAQAAILPLYFLRQLGLEAGRDFSVSRFDSDVGKHGDTGRSEREALQAVLEGEADVAAVAAASWDVFTRGGEIPGGTLTPFWTSPAYAHCNFTALDSLDSAVSGAWVTHLKAMSWEDPEHRRLMILEGLRRWVDPQLDGYGPLFEAVAQQEAGPTW